MQGVKTPAGILWNGHVAPALCLDLDGTVRYSKSGEFINGPLDVAIFPDVEHRLWEYRDNGYIILGVSNQGGVAFGHKTMPMVMDEIDAMCSLFKNNPFHLIKACGHMRGGTDFPYNKRSLCRKPDIGLLALMEVEAFDDGYVIDWDGSLFVGDREEDRECARRAEIPFQWAWEFFGRPKPMPAISEDTV